MHINANKSESPLSGKLSQEFSRTPHEYDRIDSRIQCDGITKESLLLIASEVAGHHHWQIDYSPRGLDPQINKLKSLGFSLGEPYSLVDNRALDTGDYAQVSLVAIVPIRLRNSVSVPYVIEYQRSDNFAEILSKKINGAVLESLHLDGNSVVREKTREIAEAKATRLRWAGAALGTLSLIGIGGGIYSAIEPVAAIVSNWKHDRVVSDISDLVRVKEYLEIDSSQAVATLAPITARHYSSLAISFGSILSETKEGEIALTSEQKAELLTVMAQYEIKSGRDLSDSSQPNQFFIKIFYEVIERTQSSEARAIAADGIYKLAHPEGDPVKKGGMWASFSRYMSTSERARSATMVKDLARVEKYLESDSSAIVKTLKPITADHYKAVRDSFSPEADPIVVSSGTLSERERVELLVKMMEREIASNRWIPDANSTKPFFKALLMEIVQSCSNHEGRQVAADALHRLGK